MIARVVALLVLFFAGPAALAGQLIFRPLSETLEQADRVFIGRVLKSERQDSETQSVVRLSVVPLRVLRGRTGSEVVEMSHSRVVPLIRDARGEVVGSFSPIIDGSGRELLVKEGEEWLFLVRGNDPSSPAILLRVEAADQAERIFPSGR